MKKVIETPIEGLIKLSLSFQVPQYILDDYIETCHGAECCVIVTQVSYDIPNLRPNTVILVTELNLSFQSE